MARTFNGSNNFLGAAEISITAPPFSMSIWIRPTVSSATMTAFSFGVSASAIYCAFGLLTANTSFVEIANGGTQVTNGPAGTINDGSWGHIGFAMASQTSRIVYTNGTPGTTDTANTRSFSNTHNNTRIGCLSQSGANGSLFNGWLAEAAIWDQALTDAQMALLAAGRNPLSPALELLPIRYWQLLGRESPDPELRELGLKMSPTNAPALQLDHPPVDRPPSVYLPHGMALA